MIQCPDCRQIIPEDSAFCDQCGKELKWCPECKRPKRGTECPVCGSDLIPGRKYLSGDYAKPSSAPSDLSGPAPSGPAPSGPSPSGPAPSGPSPSGPAPSGPSPSGPAPSGPAPSGPSPSGPAPSGPSPSGPAPISSGLSSSVISSGAAGGVEKSPAALVGNGWRLTLQEGPFGRRGGIWPELSTCQYVSGSHGNIVKAGADWVIEDVGSTNGTYVNGARIQRQALKKGDRVKIATLEFTVE